MFQVAFPNVVETFHRALNEVLSPFLSTGNSAALMGQAVSFYKCDLLYNNDFLKDESPRKNPFIAFIGERVGPRSTQKCLDARSQRPYAYEVRQKVFRTVFVGMGRGLEFNPPPYNEPPDPRPANMMDAENIWSQLLMVFEHQWENFNKRGIYYPTLPAIPAQISHNNYLLLTGQVAMEMRFTFTRGTN